MVERMAHTTEEESGSGAADAAAVDARGSRQATAPVDSPEPELLPPVEPTDEVRVAVGEPVTPAPDEPENEGVADVKTGPSAPRRNRPRNRRHGRRR